MTLYSLFCTAADSIALGLNCTSTADPVHGSIAIVLSIVILWLDLGTRYFYPMSDNSGDRAGVIYCSMAAEIY